MSFKLETTSSSLLKTKETEQWLESTNPGSMQAGRSVLVVCSTTSRKSYSIFGGYLPVVFLQKGTSIWLHKLYFLTNQLDQLFIVYLDNGNTHAKGKKWRLGDIIPSPLILAGLVVTL
jgi:hypothetical protein